MMVTNNQEVEKDQPLFEVDSVAIPHRTGQGAVRPRERRPPGRRRQRRRRGGAGQPDRGTGQRRQDRKEATRLDRLYKQDPGTISIRRLEVAQASWDQSKAQVTAAQADIQRAIEQMGGDDAENNTILKTALTAVAKAELDLANTVVRATARGVVTDLTTDVGRYAGTGSPVLTLIGIHDVWINAEFTENNLGHVTVGTPVDILFDVMPGRVFHGEVRSIGLGVSGSKNQPVGNLPSIQNDRDWLRQAQRFPIIIGFDVGQDEALKDQLRIGGQASVIAYSEGTSVLRLLGKVYIRIASWLSYAY